jgi:outer membrane receptor for ferrienterochelin and colicin
MIRTRRRLRALLLCAFALGAPTALAQTEPAPAAAPTATADGAATGEQTGSVDDEEASAEQAPVNSSPPAALEPLPVDLPEPPGLFKTQELTDLSADGLEEGEIVERGGILYEVANGKLVEVGRFSENDAVAGKVSLQTNVTGSRVDSSTNPVVRADVIDEKRIAESGARNVAEVLQRVGGVQISSPNGTGKTLTLDGVDGKYVLILIDGRPVNGQTRDAVDLSRLPVVASEIKRIEIVRGPMSALYGSEALGGVVNIITRRPRSGIHGEVEYATRLVNDGLQRNAINGAVSGGFSGLLFRLSASGLLERATDRAGSTDGFVTMKPDGASDIPHVRQGTLTGEVTAYPLDAIKLRGYGRFSYHELETRLGAGVPRRDHTRDLQFQAGAMAEWDIFAGHTVVADARLDRFMHRFAKLPDGGAEQPIAPFCEDPAENTFFGLVEGGGIRYRYFDAECPAETQLVSDAVQDDARLDLRYTGNLVNGVILVDELKVSTGLLLWRQAWSRVNGDFEDTLPGNNLGRTSASAYGEALYKPFSFLSLLPGFRADLAFPGAAGNPLAWALGPKLSTRLDLPWGLALRASYGQGFRLPSFSEQFLRFDHSAVGYIVEGNPDLLPETSQGFRAEIAWDTSFVRLGAEAYLNLFQNLIDTPVREQLPNGTPIYEYANRDRATTSGVNLRASLPTIWGFSGELTYQYLLMANDTSGCPDSDLYSAYFCPVGKTGGAQALLQRPTHSFHIGGRYYERLTETTFFTQMDYTSERIIDENNNRVPQTFNLAVGLRQPVLEHGELLVTLDNLLDSYHPTFGPKPGRSVMATFRAWF